MADGKKIKNRQILEEASEWAVALDMGELTPDQKQRFTDWLLQSPLHIEELLISASLFDSFESVDADKKMLIEDVFDDLPDNIISIASDAQPEVNKVTSTDNATLSPTELKAPRPWLRWQGMIAATLAIIALTGIVLIPLSNNSNQTPTVSTASITSGFSTQVGEQHKMTLDDGSVIYVNTQSEVGIRYNNEFRTVELFQGEALFDVAHDPSRPFRVIIGDTTAEAIGTTFNIFKSNDQTTVAVIDGKVAVKTGEIYTESADTRLNINPLKGQTNDGRLLLTAGQKADITPAKKTVHITSADIKAVSSWRFGQLIFESDRLADIAEQFNRYNQTHIIIVDKQLAETKFSGVFNADDPDSLIDFLEFTNDVNIDRQTQGAIRISSN